jgi:hypothetical protein
MRPVRPLAAVRSTFMVSLLDSGAENYRRLPGAGHYLMRMEEYL